MCIFVSLVSRAGDAAMQTIEELRRARGWTQLQLANKLGVTPVTVYNWERGRYEPKASQLRALAREFGVSMDEIDFEVRTRGQEAPVQDPAPLR
jgi:transcriptional regulator with XRE-family HTH domain